MMRYRQELLCALDAAKKAGTLQREKQHSVIAVSYKNDSSPVTEVDKQCEALIIETIQTMVPADAFLGEESGEIAGSSGRTWIIDPLDGTRPYLRGIPTYSVLIGLEAEQTPVLGAVYLPALDEMYWATRGNGAFCNDRPIHVSTTKDMRSVLGSCLGFFETADTAVGKKVISCMKQWDYAYGFMDAYSYMSVASGKLDICFGLIDKPWDRAAPACIVAEAGGRYSDFMGNATIANTCFVMSNGIVHDEILRALR
jgi:fructose-1,6-bisphosphatase/inositol monophosphatase family enzyme